MLSHIRLLSRYTTTDRYQFNNDFCVKNITDAVLSFENSALDIEKRTKKWYNVVFS